MMWITKSSLYHPYIFRLDISRNLYFGHPESHTTAPTYGTPVPEMYGTADRGPVPTLLGSCGSSGVSS